MNPHRLLLSLALATAPLLSQNDASEGSVLVIAQGMSVDALTALPGAGTGTLLFTRSEFSTAAPGGWAPTPGMPDWSTVFAGAPGLDIDAFSIGFDYIQSTPTGIGIVPPGNWAGITFSVTRTTTGMAGSRIAAEGLAGSNVAADIFFYVLPGSALPLPGTNLPPSLVDRTMRSQDSSEINADNAISSGNVDAHDIYVSLIFFENPQVVPTLPLPVSAFFSVSAATVPTIPPAWWGGAPASGATILRRDWVGSAWGTPYPALTPTDLGLAPLEDVDGLGVDMVRNRVLFSTTRPSATPGAPLRDPVLYHDVGTPGNFVYMTSTGFPVSSRLGLNVAGGIDDVDGVCALDPGPGSVLRLNRLIGTHQQPLSLPFPNPNLLGTAVYRRQQGTAEQFVTYMTGWPTLNTPMPGIAFVGIALGAPTNPYTTANSFLRPLVVPPPFGGHPERYIVNIPPNPIFSGLPVYFTWAAIDIAGSIDVSFPVGIDI